MTIKNTLARRLGVKVSKKVPSSENDWARAASWTALPLKKLIKPKTLASAWSESSHAKTPAR
jgi:hypothetical protein